MSEDKVLDARRAVGGLIPPYEDHIRKLEPEIRAVAKRLRAIIELYGEIEKRERVLPRHLPRTIPPGRRADIVAMMADLPVLPENPPRDFSALTAVVQRETAAREARRGQEAETIRRSGLTAIAVEGPARMGSL